MKKDSRGFTLIELLVVIVVVATLAAFGISEYNTVHNRAKVSALKVDLSNADRKMNVYFVAYNTLPVSLDDLKSNNFGGVANKGATYDGSGGGGTDRTEPIWSLEDIVWFASSILYLLLGLRFWELANKDISIEYCSGKSKPFRPNRGYA